MCGIAGWLGQLVGGEHHATGLAQALKHRGPNGCGIRSWAGGTLVHTRLSIIDLSIAGAQPMANENHTVWAVCNGEIYNHRELRRVLEARGHVFRGKSDCEVLPHLYEEEGPDFVLQLRGMFALAIFDTRTQRLTLARDRFGIKPLFYTTVSGRLAFASEIRALVGFPGVSHRPDRQAVRDFAALHYIPAPKTFYEDIKALEPGQMLVAQLDGDDMSWKTCTYHRWTIEPNHDISLSEATHQAEALLATAVHRQMESDVPLGTLLSGGIDSSLISAVAQDGRGKQLKTFNVRFSDLEYDETWAAVAVAKHIGSDHTTLDMDSVPGTWEHITDLLRHAGQPFADTSLFAAHAVCRLMRQHVTVALSGDGGDEAFGGYHFYWQIARIARLQSISPSLLRAVSSMLGPAVKIGLLSPFLPQRINDCAGADDVAIVQGLFSWMDDEQLTNLCVDGGGKMLPIRRLFEPKLQSTFQRGTSRLERLSAYVTEANIRIMLPNDFLFKVDTASMRESLEVRVPMLDEDLFAFGLSLPHHLRARGRTCKRVLRAVADRRLPPEVAKKPKQGFAIPVDRWVDSAFRVRLKETLLGPNTRLPEFFKPHVYRPLIEAFCGGRPYDGIPRRDLYQRVIMFLSLHLVAGNHEHV